MERVHKRSMIIYDPFSQNAIPDQILHQPNKTLYLQTTRKILLPGSKPRWGPSGRGLHVGGEGLGGRTHIRPDWDWQDSGELDGDGDWRWQY